MIRGRFSVKVVAFNGSPRKEGNTYHAIKMVAEELEKEGIEVEIVQVGDKAIRGCMGCNGCMKNRDEKCVIADDEVNEWIQKMKAADGIIIGSPVHYAAIGGAMKSLQALKALLDDRRLTRMQEYISKMSAKMSVVMMVFLFPALLIVLAGPSFIAISRAFGS